MSDIIKIEVMVSAARWENFKPVIKELIARYATNFKNMGFAMSFEIEGPRWEEIAQVKGIAE